ncbi:MAG: GNAT family N-acetyltransferase, partial [Lachnospiraceae bacterium]|nr:GNAT family N-acetyltransferase [Lachnospiraceae bacterium]
YQEMPSPDNLTGRCAYLMNVYTIPAMRRRGIRKVVVEWLLQEAKRCGAGKIYLEASESAYPLYKEIGFCEMDGYLKYMKEDAPLSGGV